MEALQQQQFGPFGELPKKASRLPEVTVLKLPANVALLTVTKAATPRLRAKLQAFFVVLDLHDLVGLSSCGVCRTNMLGRAEPRKSAWSRAGRDRDAGLRSELSRIGSTWSASNWDVDAKVWFSGEALGRERRGRRCSAPQVIVRQGPASLSLAP